MYKQIYGVRSLEELEPDYCKHVQAMSTERLHSKSEIAAELAYRDKEIERLREKLITEQASWNHENSECVRLEEKVDELRKSNKRLKEKLVNVNKAVGLLKCALT